MTAVHHIEQQIGAARLLPVVVLQDAGAAEPLAGALLAGGLRSVEVTFRTAAAADAIRAMAASPELLVGAGTVLTPEQVDRAIDAGARFVVSPGFGPAVVHRCQERGVPVFPGVATATEIQMALDAGLRTVKFFPAEQLGGATMVKALAAPFRGVRFIPTGGVTTANLAGYLALPAVLAVGGTWMVAPDLLAAGDWAEVTRRTAAAVAAAATEEA
jgi:2-dehydro-3-deoxyphosphogluconate aldolase/(4S)-4-hydroxy-2-oxoglutarate aldolase